MTRRRERVDQLLKGELAELLRQAKDPRLAAFVSITDVETSPDLRHARVFVSIMGEEEEKQGVMAGLKAAAGFLRHELRQRLDLRYIPELSFRRDDSIERGATLLQIIHDVTSEQPADADEKGEG